MLNIRNYGTKLWKRCILRNKNGASIKACFVDLPKDRFEEFVDFYMKYYIKEELTYRIAGLPNCEAAVAEHRQWFKNLIRSPSCHNVVCCLEDNNKNLTDIIGIDTTKIIHRTEICVDETPTNIKHEETKKYFKILREWNNLCPVPELMKKYDVQRFLFGLGQATHPEYYGYGICTQLCILRRAISKEFGVEMGGDWCTSIGTTKGTIRAGWENEYEISHEELEKILNVKIDSTLPSFKYSIFRV